MLCRGRLSFWSGLAVIIAALTPLLVTRSIGVASGSRDFWLGFPVGVAIGLALVALVASIAGRAANGRG